VNVTQVSQCVTNYGYKRSRECSGVEETKIETKGVKGRNAGKDHLVHGVVLGLGLSDV
jgi:hypothetical protein